MNKVYTADKVIDQPGPYESIPMTILSAQVQNSGLELLLSEPGKDEVHSFTIERPLNYLQFLKENSIEFDPVRDINRYLMDLVDKPLFASNDEQGSINSISLVTEEKKKDIRLGYAIHRYLGFGRNEVSPEGAICASGPYRVSRLKQVSENFDSYTGDLDIDFVDPYGFPHKFTFFDPEVQQTILGDGRLEAIGFFKGSELKWIVPYAEPITTDNLNAVRQRAGDRC